MATHGTAEAVRVLGLVAAWFLPLPLSAVVCCRSPPLSPSPLCGSAAMATHGTAEAVPFWGLVVPSFVGIAAKNARFGRFFGFCGLRKIKQSISAAAGIFLFLGGFFFFWGALQPAEQPLPVAQPKG